MAALPLKDVPVALPEPELLNVTALVVVAPVAAAQTKADPFHCRYVVETVGATTNDVVLAPV